MGISNSRAASNRRAILSGLRADATLGDVWYVDSTATGATDTAGAGRTPTSPFATVNFAIGQATASNNDIIILAHNHAETISTATTWEMNKIGIRVVGMGYGNQRPLFTLSATAAIITFSAIDSTIENCRFTVITQDSANYMSFTAVDCSVINCQFFDNATIQSLGGILIGGSDNACDGTSIIGCRFESVVGGTAAISLATVQDNILIDDCWVDGDYSIGCIHNPTSEVLTNLTIKQCFLRNRTTGQPGIELISACTGQIIECYITTDIAGVAGMVNGSTSTFQNFTDDQETTTSAILAPASGA